MQLKILKYSFILKLKWTRINKCCKSISQWINKCKHTIPGL